jgi:hypothetical protein
MGEETGRRRVRARPAQGTHTLLPSPPRGHDTQTNRPLPSGERVAADAAEDHAMMLVNWHVRATVWPKTEEK